ncbi:MAG: hypothetical protein VKJ24_09830 [Synechococcales bacterium]|nr:hypothetical protein [Synechococcales bacterium]
MTVSTVFPSSALATKPTSTGSASTSTPVTVLPSASYSFDALFNPTYGSTENTGASAAVNFNFLQIGDKIQLDVTLNNTTNGKAGLGATQATLVGLAFDAPTLWDLSLKTPGGSFTKFWEDVDLNPFGTFSYGISPDRNSFGGGNANTGIKVGDAAIKMSFDLKGTGLTAETASKQFTDLFKSGTAQMATRFQQVNAGGGSDKVKGQLMIAEVPPPKKKVPEPALGVGLLTIATIAARKTLKQQKR